MATRTHHDRSRGFTLIETVAAIVILAIAIPPMLWSVRQGHILRVNPMMVSKACWLASEKIEDIIADRHSTTRGFTYLVAGNYPAETPITGFPGFTRTVSFTQTGSDLISAGTGYMRVTVNVGWTDATATVRTLSASAIVTDY